MPNSDPYSPGARIEPARESTLDKASEQVQAIASSVKDKTLEAADTVAEQSKAAAQKVQRASVDAYHAGKQTVQDRPVVIGLMLAAVLGVAIGALWKLNARSRPRTLLDTLHDYGDPYLRSLENMYSRRNW